MTSAAAAEAPLPSKKEGDISSVFVSLSGGKQPPLPPRFRDLKLSLVADREKDISASWYRLLNELAVENQIIARSGSAIIPSVEFRNLDRDLGVLKEEIRKRGCAVIRGVVPVDEARAYKFEVEEYVRKNPHTKCKQPCDI
jgi:Protein of unknown function (DUF1479)